MVSFGKGVNMTVFIVQKHMKYDDQKEQFVPKFDVSSARQFGNVEFLLSPTANPFNPNWIIDELHNKLQNFSSEDYLLLVGNPCLIGMVVAIAAYYSGGRVRLLQWSGKDQKYVEIDITLFDLV